MHVKRLSAPSSWPIARKGARFVVRPFPGSQGFAAGTSLSTFLVEMTHHVETNADLKRVLNAKQVLVDGTARTHPRAFVGLFDTVELPALKKAYRLVLGTHGLLLALPIPVEESKLKMCKVIGKTSVTGGAVQLNLHDGTNIVMKDANHKIGDSVLLSLPDRVPVEHVRLEKDALVYLNSGSYQGSVGKVVALTGTNIRIAIKNETIETPTKCAMVIGKSKPLITVVSA